MNILTAEIKKLIKNRYWNRSMYFSLVIWPILILVNTFFVYLSFDFRQLQKFGIHTSKELTLFLWIGTLGLNLFFSMMQSAIDMSQERKDGTLEMIFISPCSKVVLLYSRAMSAILENIWITCFFFCTFLWLYGSSAFHFLAGKIFALSLLSISAVFWGGFMNSIFLFSRDATFLYNIIDMPMDLFSGVRFPVHAFPKVLQMVSAIYPLTYALNIMRGAFLNEKILWNDILRLSILLFIFAVLTVAVTKVAEKNGKEKGSFTFY